LDGLDGLDGNHGSAQPTGGPKLLAGPNPDPERFEAIRLFAGVSG